jgi:hypothetical protein
MANLPAIRWCEASVRSVEYVNTFSNAAYVVAAILGLRAARKCELPLAFYLTEYALLVVACGSFLFHFTQSWRAEVLDELPMSALALCYLYTLQQLHWLTRGRSQTAVTLAAIAATALSWLAYVRAHNFAVFEAFFTVQILLPALISRAAAGPLAVSPRAWHGFVFLALAGKFVWNVERRLWHARACPASAANPLYWCHAAWHGLSAAAHAVAMAFHKDLYLAARSRKLVGPIQPQKRVTSVADLAAAAGAADLEAAPLAAPGP